MTYAGCHILSQFGPGSFKQSGCFLSFFRHVWLESSVEQLLNSRSSAAPDEKPVPQQAFRPFLGLFVGFTRVTWGLSGYHFLSILSCLSNGHHRDLVSIILELYKSTCCKHRNLVKSTFNHRYLDKGHLCNLCGHKTNGVQ